MDTISITKNPASPARVGIVMPLYNRKHFLDQAFSSFIKQEFTDWTLVIVDDGSSDDPLPKVKELFGSFEQQVLYVSQENTGPGAARQTGLEALPNSQFYAFFDSDDEWTPDYLSTAIKTLEVNPDVDWVYMACRRIDHFSGDVLLASTFRSSNDERVGFFNLPIEHRDSLGVFTNNTSTVLEQIKKPLDAGFQNSVIRGSIIKACKIPSFRIGEDRFFFTSALLKGFKVGFIDKIGVIYHVHDSNLSDTNSAELDFDKKFNVQNQLLESFKALQLVASNYTIQNALKKEIANILFWQIAYNTLLPAGHKKRALAFMRQAIRYCPFKFAFYKTYLAKLLSS